MGVYQHQSIEIHDRSSIGEARRVSTRLAARCGLDTDDQGRVPLVVTELATNLLSHARRGEMLIRMLVEEGGIEVLAIDHGPGISDLAKCLADGYSKRGTRGCGLGAVQRQSTEFDIYSTEPAGTIVLSRILPAKRPRSHRVSAAVCVVAPGESECGDGWQVRYREGRLAAVVIDGLGHGPLAAAATEEALAVFNRDWFRTPVDFLAAAHEAMRSTRGAAVAIAHIDIALHQLHYAGVGNIAARIVSPGIAKQQPLISHAGIVGGEFRKLQQFDYKWEDGDLLVMHSDGLSERWKVGDYPGLAMRDVAMTGGALYRDAKRGRDDATVLVTRLGRS